VVIRVLGATCNDKTQVPLPNMRVTITGADKTTATAMTDVTGLAILPAPAPAKAEEEPRGRGEQVDYKLTVAASDGSTVANVEGDRSRAHILTLGDGKHLEAHATLGRGWLAAIDRAEKERDRVTKTAAADIATVEKLTTTRIEAVTKRLDLHLRKK
jgi:hypothetical protein